MSIFSTRPGLRWLLPATVAVAIVGGGLVAQSVASSAVPDLPERSAAQLLVDLQTANLTGLSGTVRTNADLGLPQLPLPDDQGSAELGSLVSGSRTLRVWYAGPDKVRVALMGTLGESDIIRNGKDVWTWNSRERKAEHSTLDSRPEAPAPTPSALPSALPKTPQEAADLALKAIDPSTDVRTGTNARVAGRAAYELILSPKDTASLVGELRLAIDADAHVPLRFQIFAKGVAEPAYEVAFTQVSFDRPDDAQFAFNPPPGTTVEEAKPSGSAPDKPAMPDADLPEPKVVGTGWTSVLVVPKLPDLGAATPQQGGEGAMLQRVLKSLPRASGDWGSGSVLSTRLFTVLITDDGRAFAGAVTPQRLFEVARG